MTGLEVRELYVEHYLQKIKNKYTFNSNQLTIQRFEDSIKINGISMLNDNIEMIFSPNDSDLAITALQIWFNKITTYSFNDYGNLILDKSVFWNIYKGATQGKELLTSAKYKLLINNKPRRFVNAEYYFKHNQNAIYGIYYKDELIYIGSSTDYPTRWAEHYLSFGRESYNSMYQECNDVKDELEFKILYNEDEIRKIFNKENEKFFSAYYMEMVEEQCIKHYQPKYNIEGITKPFQYAAKRLPKIQMNEAIEALNKNFNLV